MAQAGSGAQAKLMAQAKADREVEQPPRKEKNIVVIGGGTGSYNVLSGL